MNFIKYLRFDQLSLYLTSTWLLFLFLFNPHFVELTGTLETWFPYKGLIYYKDFAAYHFPLGRLILLPFHLLTNWNLEIGPFLGLISGIGSLTIIYLFGKKYLSKIGTSLALFFFTIFFWYVATGILFFHEILIGLILAAILLLLFDLIEDKKISTVKLFILGILIALAQLSGQIATITLLTITIIQLIKILSTNKKVILYKNLGFFLLGIVTPILFVSLYFIANNAFGEFFYYNITYYLQYAGYEKGSLFNLPLKDLAAYYIPLIVMLALIANQYLRGRRIALNNWIILILSLSTIPFILFSVYHPHHLSFSLPILAICLGMAYDLSLTQGFGKTVFFLGTIYLIYVLTSNIIPWHFQRFIFPPTIKIFNDIYPDSKDPMKGAIDWLRLNTQANTKILVVGDALFYLRADRLPNNRPSKGIPYAWNPLDKIKEEIKNNLSDFWIIDRQFLAKLILNHNRPDMVEFVDQTLRECFIKVTSFKNWEIWQRVC